MPQFINGAWVTAQAHDVFENFPDIAADVAEILAQVEAADPGEYDPATLSDLAKILVKAAQAVAHTANRLADRRRAIGLDDE